MYTYPTWPRIFTVAMLFIIMLATIAIAANVKEIRDNSRIIVRNTCVGGASSYRPDGTITETGCTP